MTIPELSIRNQRFAAFFAVAAIFLGGVHLGLLIPVYAGLLVYAAVHHLGDRLQRRGQAGANARKQAVAIIASVVIGLMVLLGVGIKLLLHSGAGLHDLLLKMSDILATSNTWLPSWATNSMPQQDALLGEVVGWLKAHAGEIGGYSLALLKGLGYALIGTLLGLLVAISSDERHSAPGPLSQRLILQIGELREAFWRVAAAQIRISAVNTTLTLIYLLIVLPIFGVHLPFAKTLVGLTFIAGMLPIVGNLVSNTAITVISLSVSLHVAAASLAFLILVHKLEYFINARIIGSQINARAWEMLLAMLLMERLFGPAGVVAAPVFYTWLKAEWQLWDRQPAPVATPHFAKTVHGGDGGHGLIQNRARASDEEHNL